MSFDFTGKTAIVTGSGSGIGRQTAKQFADGGANVVVAELSVDAGKETVQQIQRKGGEAMFVKTDVRNAASVENMVEKAVKTYGQLDIAHNNAGIEGSHEGLTEQPEENWDRVVDTNLKGMWLCLKYELRAMKNERGGAIVNTSSISGLSGAGNTPYVASKHGVIGLTRSAATEFAKEGIRVNALCPGATDTPLYRKNADPESEKQFLQAVPMGRLASPTEIANTVVWLCSEQASFATGGVFPVDGGYSAW